MIQLPDQPDVPTPWRFNDRLPCGTEIDELVDQVAEGTPARDPAHQHRCPHCRAALPELTELWDPVAQLAAEEVHAPADLLQEVMDKIRGLSRDGWTAVLVGDGGDTRIAARVISTVARLAAESVPHVTLALGGRWAAAGAGPARAAGEPATRVATAGSRVVIDVTIVVDHGVALQQVAAQVRDRIIGHVTGQTGLTVSEVDVTVIDVR